MEIEHFVVDNGVLGSIADFVRANPSTVAWAFVDSIVAVPADTADHNAD